MSSFSALLPVDNGPFVETFHQASINRLLKQDNSLPEYKKKSLLAMLNTPEAFDHLMAGVTGAAIMRSALNYSKLSSPARTLLGLAGFSIGNILYNYLIERKHTQFDHATGKTRILL